MSLILSVIWKQITVGEPVYLFKANDPVWTDHKVTDGPFLYEAKNGSLIMIWSNFSYTSGYWGYTVSVSTSKSGSILGPWEHSVTPLFYQKTSSGDIKKVFDGGHAALFTDADGSLKLSLHISNSVHPKLFIIELEEKNNTLVFKYNY